MGQEVQSDKKQYSSLFVPTENIDVSNYIAETLIVNYLDTKKQHRPTSAFWRKDIAKNNKTLQFLAKKYQDELVEIKRYLRVYSAQTIIKILNKNNYMTLRYLKKENRQQLCYQLFLEEEKFIKNQSKTVSVNKKEFTKVSTRGKDNKWQNV